MNDSEILFRELTFDKRGIDEKARTAAVAFSSETAVDRWFGSEILDHTPGAADLRRMNNGAPVLLEHDRNRQVGVVVSARIDGDQVGRATIRFGRSALAEEVWRDVVDLVRTKISIGYRFLGTPIREEKNGQEVFRIPKWEVLELSVVAVAADDLVGVARALGKENMEPKSTDELLREIQSAGSQSRAVEEQEIAGIAQHWAERRPDIADAACQALSSGMGLREFRQVVMKMLSNSGNALRTPPPSALIGMSEREVERYSLGRALLAAADGKLDGIEREAHEAGSKQAREQGLQLQGNVFIPHDVIQHQRATPEQAMQAWAQRDQLVSTATLGGNTVATNLLAGSFIEVLRNEMMVARLGAMTLNGLVGNVAIPRQSGHQAAVWMASETAEASSADITFDQVTLAPKTLTAIRFYSKLLLAQSTPSIDTLVRNDVALSVALGLDLAALYGPGTAGQPTGIIAQTGVGVVLCGNGTNGADPTRSDIIDLEADVAGANAARGSLAYLTSTSGRRMLKTIPKSTVVGFNFIWEPYPGTPPFPGAGMLNGYLAGVSGQVTSGATVGTSSGNVSYMFFGDWSEVLIGLWGGLDVLADPYTLATTRMVRVSAHQFCDVGLRHGEAFSVITDMETS